jgi:hypothetical protein
MPNPTFASANLQWLGLATETVYGTATATPSLFVPVDTPTWKPTTASIVDSALRGSMATEHQQINGLRFDTVTFKTFLYLDSAFTILRAALGLPDVISGAADPYTHKTSLQSGNNGQPAGTTVFWYDAAGKAWQMAGSVVQTVKIGLKQDGLATLDVTYIGLPAVPITPPSNTPTTQLPAPSWNSTITIGGIAYSKYSELDIEIKRATEMIPTITGTQAPFAIFGGPVTVAGTLNGIYQGSTDTDLLGDLTNLQPTLLVKVSPAGDAVHSFSFQASKVAYEDTTVTGSNKWMEIKSTLRMLANTTDVAGGGNLSPLLVTALTTASTAL